jgi:hypothetical protein
MEIFSKIVISTDTIVNPFWITGSMPLNFFLTMLVFKDELTLYPNQFETMPVGFLKHISWVTTRIDLMIARLRRGGKLSGVGWRRVSGEEKLAGAAILR